jgi:beta-glucosidase
MPAARRNRFRPRLETLEDRCLLSGSGNPAVVPAAPDVQWMGENVRVSLHRGHPAVVVLGDSILARFADGPGAAVWQQQIAPLGATDFAVPGSTTQNILWQLNHRLLSGLSPRLIVLMIGTNNLSAGNSPEQVAEGIASCLGAIEGRQRRARILLLGILPRGDTPDTGIPPLVQQTNALLAGVTAAYHVAFLDPGPALLGPGGVPAPGVLSDIVHPTAAGYQMLAGEICPAVLGLLTAAPGPSR